MERRYEAYKTHVVKPFFREHIARLDRQIVLIDAMQALNAGPGAMADLERALTEILACFRPGRGSFLTDLFSRAHRPHPDRRDQGRPSAPRKPRPAAGDRAPAGRPRHQARGFLRRRGRRAGDGRGPGDPRGHGQAGPRDAAGDHRHAAGRRDDRRRDVRRQDRNRDISRRLAGEDPRSLFEEPAPADDTTRTGRSASCASGRRSWNARRTA